MLRNCACLVIAHMVDATQLSLSCACLPKLTGTQCLDQTWKQLKRYIPKELRSRDQTTRRDNHRLEEYVWSFLFRMNVRPKLLEALGKFGPKSKQCYKIEKKTSFFRRRLLIRRNSIVYSFLKTRTHGKNGTKSTCEPTNHTWNSTPSQHFVHLQQNAMLISLRVAITAVTLFVDRLPYSKLCTLNRILF